MELKLDDKYHKTFVHIISTYFKKQTLNHFLSSFSVFNQILPFLRNPYISLQILYPYFPLT